VLSIIITGLASLIPVRIATGVDPAIVLRGE
jgi:putative ABC transport system permease protein